MLTGQRGSGKSCSMVNLVAWARSEGYDVIYIPGARALTQESSYQKDDASGLWDTPEHAKLFLRLAMAGNAELFATTEVTTTGAAAGGGGGGGDGGKKKTTTTTLAALVKNAEDAFEKEPKAMVEAALVVIEEIKRLASEKKRKVMFAIDEYNALFGPTDMHEVLGARKRGNIAAGSTRLNAALRDANAMTAAGCTYIGATSETIQLSPKVSDALGSAAAPGSEALTPMEVGRMNMDEVLSMVMHYEYAKGGLGAVHRSVDPLQLAMRLKVLTQGNGKEMREMVVLL